MAGGPTFFVRQNGQRGGEDAGVACSEAIGRVGVVVVGEGRRRRDSPRAAAAAVAWRRLLPLLDGERHSETCNRKRAEAEILIIQIVEQRKQSKGRADIEIDRGGSRAYLVG